MDIKIRYVYKNTRTGEIKFEIHTIESVEQSRPSPSNPQIGYILIGRDLSTGLFDKFKKEIYGNDIVKYFGKWDEKGRVISPDFVPHRISWVMGGFHAIPMDIHTALSSSAKNWKGVGHTDCEIIGNTYEKGSIISEKE